MDFDELVELMEEPPGGHNHGRKKGESGGWIPLETPGVDTPSFKRWPGGLWSGGQRKHGTAYVANKLRCKCDDCQSWKAGHQRRMRARRHNHSG